nr:uncharacterized protein LOC112937958 isoform X2 [Oryza sativa Japonica Group]
MPAGPPTPHLQALSLPAGSPSSPRGGIWSCTSATAQLEQSTGWSGLGSGTDWTRRRWYTSGQSLVRIYFRQASRPDLGPCSGNHWIWGLRGWMPSPASSLRWQSPDLGPLRLDSVDGSFGARMEVCLRIITPRLLTRPHRPTGPRGSRQHASRRLGMEGAQCWGSATAASWCSLPAVGCFVLWIVGVDQKLIMCFHRAKLCIYIVIGTQKLQLPRQEIKMSRMAL